LKFKHIVTTLVILLIPSFVIAADIDITCNGDDSSPTIVRNRDPLFDISNFIPGKTESRDISITNNDDTNPCVIDFEGRGSFNDLTNVITVYLDNIYISTLTEFIDGLNIPIATVQPTESVNRTMELKFNESSGNMYADNSPSFDILINSQWGSETDNGDILGEDDDSCDIAGVSDKRDLEDGEVMGVSTTLPATGANLSLVIISLIVMIIGLLINLSLKFYKSQLS
jgi:hypothetical protein